MKVIKVIVDELPESCFFCNLTCDNDFGDIQCTADNEFRDIEDTSIRPDWCPLVSSADMEKILHDLAMW